MCFTKKYSTRRVHIVAVLSKDAVTDVTVEIVKKNKRQIYQSGICWNLLGHWNRLFLYKLNCSQEATILPLKVTICMLLHSFTDNEFNVQFNVQINVSLTAVDRGAPIALYKSQIMYWNRKRANIFKYIHYAHSVTGRIMFFLWLDLICLNICTTLHLKSILSFIIYSFTLLIQLVMGKVDFKSRRPSSKC